MKNYAYAPFSDTRTLLFFNTFFKNQTLYSSVGYNHETAHFYGFSRTHTPDSLHFYYDKPHRDSLKNNFHHVYAEIGLRSNFVQEDAKLKQDVRLNYNFIHTYRKDMENSIGLASSFAYDVNFSKLNGFFRPQLDVNVDYYMNEWQKETQSASNRFSSYKLEFVPTVKFAIREYHLRIGVGLPIINSFGANMQGDAKCPIYPVAELQLGIVPGILSIYGGIDGNTNYNTLKDLLYENPFLKSGLDSLQFTKTQISVYGGIKGNLVKKMNYHISARYSHTNDMKFFFLDTTSLLKNQFDVLYSNVNLLNVCANLNWQVVDRLYLNAEANYWGYFNLNTIERPWYKPTWEVAFSGKYYLKEKFIFDLNMKLGFDSWGVRYISDDEKSRIDPPYDMMISPNYLLVKMKPVLNFGVGFEYLVTKRFSCFAMINNVGFQHFSKYYDFNNLGFNAIIGVTYSFGDESLRRGKR